MDIIVYGTYEPLLEDSDSIWAYRRHLDGQTLTVACNWTDKDVECDLFDEGDELVISNYETHTPGILAPYEAYVTIRND
jgi:oligo-1,6-glucosidase